MGLTYSGLLCIGDPHLASRVPGFRKDDYPRTMLRKLRWALDYAREERLLPLLLGDLFHWPRDNANWLLVELFGLFRGDVLAITGNHDCKANELGPDDTLALLCAAGHVRLLERSGPWRGKIKGRVVVVGGSAWGQRLPKGFDRRAARVPQGALVVWLTHHDIRFRGYEDSGRFHPFEIPGVDIVVNGHIHRTLDDSTVGATTWLNPGNIARVRRGDADRERRPGLLRIDVAGARWSKQRVELPHDPFDQVFHKELAAPAVRLDESQFVRGLAELELLKTQGGAPLQVFLEHHLAHFDPRVAETIRALAKEVISDEPQQPSP